MEFLNSNLHLILCFLVGFGLLLTEAFMPGFGVAGVLGIIAEVFAIYSAWVHYGPLFAFCLTVIILVLIVLTVFLSYRSAMKGRLSRSSMILKEAEAPAEIQAQSLQAYAGQEGVTSTPLRPAGQIELGGRKLNAASGGDFLPKGTKVVVTGAEGDHVLVQPAAQS